MKRDAGKYRVSANRELFDAWILLGSKIAQMKSATQNDMTITEAEVTKWNDGVRKLAAELEDLRRRTLIHLTSG